MKLLKQILFLSYITSILCDYEFDYGTNYEKYINDVITCGDVSSEPTADICKARNNYLTAEGSWKNNCCYYKYNVDITYGAKILYPETWQSYIGGSSNYLPLKQCYNVMTESALKNFFLYSTAVTAENGEVKYDCGDGEVTFKSSEYNPTDTNELSLKEFVDCRQNYNQNDCIGKSKQFQTSTQCCWLSATFESAADEKTTISMCFGLQGFSKEDFTNYKSTLTKTFSDMGENKDMFDFVCADKNRKKVTGTYNNGTVIIEKTEDMYSNYLGVGFLGIISLIGLLF